MSNPQNKRLDYLSYLLGLSFVVEAINDELKKIAQIEHSRHRLLDNFMVNLQGALAVYVTEHTVIARE